jgi:hypothetical protein
MKKITSKKSVWSPDDLQKCLAEEGGNAFKVDKHWQQALTILASDSEKGDSEMSESTYPLTSLEVTRMTQIVRHHLMTISRRRLSGGTKGLAIIPVKSILQHIAGILKRHLFLRSAGESISPASEQQWWLHLGHPGVVNPTQNKLLTQNSAPSK